MERGAYVAVTWLGRILSAAAIALMIITVVWWFIEERRKQRWSRQRLTFDRDPSVRRLRVVRPYDQDSEAS